MRVERNGVASARLPLCFMVVMIVSVCMYAYMYVCMRNMHACMYRHAVAHSESSQVSNTEELEPFLLCFAVASILYPCKAIPSLAGILYNNYFLVIHGGWR